MSRGRGSAVPVRTLPTELVVLWLMLPEIFLRIGPACDLDLDVHFLRLVLGVLRDVCFLDECGILNSITDGE